MKREVLPNMLGIRRKQTIAFCAWLILFLVGCGVSLPSKKSNEDSPTSSASDHPAQADPEKSDDPAEEKKDEPIVDPVEDVKQRTACSTTWTKPAANLKIEDVIALINTLPRPVTIPCVLDVLPRPFAVNATTSDLSVQPGEGVGNPRVFVKIDFLLISFTMAANEPPTLEFSQLLNDDESVKGEILFPVDNMLLSDAAFAGVVRPGNIGTRCAACHFSERLASPPFPANAFVSRALRPFERQSVSFEILIDMVKNCAAMATPRCDLLNALFRGAEPTPYVFPVTMGTLF